MSVLFVTCLCFWAVQAVFAFASTSVQTTERRRLETVPFTTPISKGQTHEYVLTLGADEYAKIVLQQQGVDVVMTVEIDGVARFEVDVANGSAGYETISLLGGTADYVIKVRPRTKDPEPGSYQIAISDRGLAIDANRNSVAAERLFLEGTRTRRERSAKAVSERLAKFDEARRRWHDLGDRQNEALALLNRGMEYHVLDMLSAALADYDEALRLYQELGSPLDEANAQLKIGITKLRWADNEGALASFTKALAGFQAANDQKYVGATLYQIGRVHYLDGKLTEALSSFREALPVRHRLNDLTGEAYTLSALGRVYVNGFGDFEEALRLYNQALELVPTEPRVAAQVHADLGRLYFLQTRYDDASAEYQKALKKFSETDALAKAEVMMYEGMVHAAKGSHQQALDTSFIPALEIQSKSATAVANTLEMLKSAEADLVGLGHTLKNAGLSYAALGQTETALKHLDHALMIWNYVVYRTAEADTRYEIARIENKRGNFEKAEKQIEAAFPVVELLRSKIANQYLRTSYFASAQKYYELYIDVLMSRYKQTGDRNFQARALNYSERARARSMLDTLIESRADIRSGAKEEDLSDEARLQLKLNALSQNQLIKPGTPEKEASGVRAGIASLMSEYRELEARIRRSSPRYAALTRPEPLSLEKIQSYLRSDQLLLEYALGEERSYVWAVTSGSIESYELPGRSELERRAENVRSLLVEPHRSATARTRRYSEEYERAAVSLSEILLGRVKSLAAAKSLLIVASGKLQYLSFAAMPVPARETQTPPLASPQPPVVPLLVYHEIEMLPSLSVVAEIGREQLQNDQSKKEKVVAVIADPVFGIDDDRFTRTKVSQSDPKPSGAGQPKSTSQRANLISRMFKNGRVPRLGFSRREADEILSIVQQGKGDRIIDFRATRQFVTGARALSQYQIVHFATHGLIDDQYPELSGLLLSLYDEEGRPLNGLLQVHDVYNLNIPASLVVLSACETSIGKEMKGEGLPGLSRAFIYAGARRVVASLWEVGDASTAELMSIFYRKLLTQKMSTAAALREAQLEMWRKNPKNSPYFWAAFITHGDPRF